MKAVILVSGGLDSATVCGYVKSLGAEIYAISFDYGQRHKSELKAAEKVAKMFGAVRHEMIPLSFPAAAGNALTDSSVAVPKDTGHSAGASDDASVSCIPVTYVPARNTLFLSYALGYAEVVGAKDIYIGASSVDYSGYPDCRPEYFDAFNKMAAIATKVGVEGEPIQISTPLLYLTKAQTIALGMKHGVDYSITVSCYDADDEGRACGRCDSCQLRKKGFFEAGVEDVTRYF
ncbi:MAG: 7-cyano-7-deazaguanine synthase QueC [Gammaproteobacteria bacterium]